MEAPRPNRGQEAEALARAMARRPQDPSRSPEEDPQRLDAAQPSERILQVRRHQMEILARGFPMALMVFTVLYAMLSVSLLALLGWLIVSFAQEFNKECDVPLQLWAAVDLGSTGYHAIHGVILQYFFTSDRDPTQPLPLYERVHLIVVTVFDFVWLGLGLHWIRSSSTCHETSPKLFSSSEAYALTSTVGSAFMCINMIGLYTIMGYLLRNGALRTKEGAPAGTLSKLKVVPFDAKAELFQANPECCICLAPFSKTMEVRQTPCGHTFHARCLGNWLKVNRTCPLCRMSLVPEQGAAAPSQPGEEEQQRQSPHHMDGQHHGDLAPSDAGGADAAIVGAAAAADALESGRTQPEHVPRPRQLAQNWAGPDPAAQVVGAESTN